MDVKLLWILQVGIFLTFQNAIALPEPIQQNTKTTTLSSQSTEAAKNSTPSTSTAKLLTNIHDEKSFSTLVIWRQESANCFDAFDSTASANERYAKLIFSDNFTLHLKAHYNHELLNVICFSDFIDFWLLENVAESLEHMRGARLLFALRGFNATQAEYDLAELFSYCDQQQMLNVLAIYDDFAKTFNFYSFTRFPNFTMERRRWPTVAYYPNRVGDLQGHALSSIPSQHEPASIVYTDREGQQHSAGYIYHLISTFASRLNATLQYKKRVHVGDRIEISILQELTRNNALDLPICLKMPVVNESLYGYSDIVEISNWMPMLPRSGYIERWEIFKKLFSKSLLALNIIVFITFSMIYKMFSKATHHHLSHVCKSFYCNIELFCNDRIFRGVLGLPFEMRCAHNFKFYLLSLLIFQQGIIWSSIYNGQLHALYSRLPLGEQMNSFADLKAHGIQIAIPQEHFEMLERVMSFEFMRDYVDIFLIVPELRDFYSLRKSFNTNFAYSVDSEIWAMFDRQQHYFSQRLFRISDELQFVRHHLLAVPLAENSVYRAAFNSYLLDVQAYGFWNHWTEMSFYEMAKAGKLSFEDLTSNLSEYRSLCLGDFYYIWWLYFAGNVLSCFCIVAEVLRKKFAHVDVQRVTKEYFAELWNSIK